MKRDARDIPLPTIRRLPSYYRVLRAFQAEGQEVASATRIAEQLHLDAIQVRKDLAQTGAVGRPRIGFEVKPTIECIEATLGWQTTTEAFLVGVGHLGSALLGYEGFEEHGLKIVAAFDTDPEVIGKVIDGTKVWPTKKLPAMAKRLNVCVAVLTVPGEVAQRVTDDLIQAGMCGIWNFAPRRLDVPEGVIVQNENLSSGLAVLTARVTELLHGRGGGKPTGSKKRTD